MHTCCNKDHRSVVGGKFFVSRRYASPLLEAIDASLNNVAPAVTSFVERYGPFPVGTRGNDRLDAALAQGRSQSRTVVAFVAGQSCWTQPWAAATDPLNRTGIDEAYELRRVVLLTAGEREDERVAFAISAQMDFCTEPSSAAAERAESPFFPPAACWWARITVLSMQCISQSSNPRPSACVWRALKTLNKVPLRRHR